MLTLDTLQNLVAGLFTAKDKMATDSYILPMLARPQLEAAYRGDWIARKVVDVPPSDMTREWRSWQAEQDQIEALEAEEKRLNARQKVKRALVRARLYGGVAIIIGVNQGDVHEELRVESIGKGALQYVHVASRHELSAGEINRDVMSSLYGEPLYYEVSSQSLGSMRIHPSRVIRLIGNEIPDIALAHDGWGDSVLQSVNDAVRHAGLAAQGIASLIHEAKVDVIKVPNLMASLTTAEYTERLTKRFTLAGTMKSINNTLLLDKEEEWDRKQISFTQLPEVLTQYLQIAAGAADIPATRLIGQDPKGLNATGDSDIRNYYDRISSEQETMLTPALERLDEVLIRSALGARDPAIHYEWAPLWQMSEAEKADIAKKKAETTQIYVNTALVPVEALAKATTNQLIEDGTYPGLEQAMEEAAPLDLEDIPQPESEDNPDQGSVKPDAL